MIGEGTTSDHCNQSLPAYVFFPPKIWQFHGRKSGLWVTHDVDGLKSRLSVTHHVDGLVGCGLHMPCSAVLLPSANQENNIFGEP